STTHAPGGAVSGSGRVRGVDVDGSGHALEGHRPDLARCELAFWDRLDDLACDEHFARAGVVGEAGGDVHGTAEIVTLLEHHGTGVDPHPGGRQLLLVEPLEHDEGSVHTIGGPVEVEHHAVAEELDEITLVLQCHLAYDRAHPGGELGGC